MRPWMRTGLLLLGALAVSGVLVWRWLGGAGGLVDLALPEFPELPAPAERLAADQQGRIYFSSSTPFDFDVLIGEPELARPTTGVGTLFLPESATAEEPVPAVVLLHGSGGITPGREMTYGEMLASHGYAAFVIDYYRPRGFTRDIDYMLRVLSVTEFDAVADAYAALRLLRTHPAIDPERVGVAGFSYGGMAVRIAMDTRVADALLPGQPAFAAHVDYYGPCFQKLNSPEATGGPLLTLRGTEDASNELPACLRREAEWRALGVEVEPHVYPGAGHAWENTEPRHMSEDSPYVVGCEFSYDPQGRPVSQGRILVDVTPGTSRAERIAARMSTGGILGECVRSGYIVGRDDATKALSDDALLAFLARVL